MSVQVTYTNKNIAKSLVNYAFFTLDKFKIDHLKKILTKVEMSYALDILKKSNLKKNLLHFNLSSKKSLILISVKESLKNSEAENLGAEFYDFIKINSLNNILLKSESLKRDSSSTF